MAFTKGNKAGRSRKGRPNKLTRDVREMILSALAGVGGVNYLQQQAAENPAAFMALVGKTLPRDVNVGGGLRLEVNLIGVERSPSD